MPRLPTHSDADVACSLYVYSHCSCCEAVKVLMIVNELSCKSMASIRRLTFATVKSDGTGTTEVCHACDIRTDGRTDRRMDRILIARPRLHSMQRGNNYY